MSKICRSYFPFIALLFTVMLMAFGSEVKGQRVYAVELNNGNTPGVGGSRGTLGSVGSAGTASVVNPTNINGTKNTNSADLITNSGGPGTGLGPGAGTASTAFITISFTGSSTPKTGNPIYIKGTATAASSGLLDPLLENPGNRVSLQAFNGVTPVGASVLLASLSSNSNGEYIFNAPGDLTSVKITVTTDLGYVPVLGLLAGGVSTASLKLYYAFFVAPPIVSGTSICSGSKASLSVSSPVTGLTYNWYTAATGGDLVNTGTSYSPNLTANTTYYVEVTDGGQFFSARTPVTVTVNPLPTLSTTQTATTITTSGTVAFTATSSASTIKWYDNSGVLKFTGSNPTFGPFSTPGTYTYQVIADNGTCSNSSTVSFSVYSTTACPPLTKRVYGDRKSVV